MSADADAFRRLAVHEAQRHPGKAARSVTYHRTRIAGLEGTGHTSDLARHQALLDGYLHALRSAGRCERCGRPLTDPASVERGIGPDCLEAVSGGNGER